MCMIAVHPTSIANDVDLGLHRTKSPNVIDLFWTYECYTQMINISDTTQPAKLLAPSIHSYSPELAVSSKQTNKHVCSLLRIKDNQTWSKDKCNYKAGTSIRPMNMKSGCCIASVKSVNWRTMTMTMKCPWLKNRLPKRLQNWWNSYSTGGPTIRSSMFEP